jgi:hypothetical protein
MRRREAKPLGLDSWTSDKDVAGFAHDFSRIPVHAETPVRIQAKLVDDARQAHASGEVAVPPVVNDVLNSTGRPLDAATRGLMESGFGHDFSQVRVHTKARASEAASAINARAFTVDRDIVFSDGAYAPQTQSGRHLLSHELAHVMQQRAGVNLRSGVGKADDAYERHADALADQVTQGRTSLEGMQATGHEQNAVRSTRAIQRQPVALGKQADAVKDELRKVLAVSTWAEIRKRIYPKESAAGIQRNKDRKAGKEKELTGLGRIKTLDHFAAAMKGIQTNWTRLGTADKRTVAVADAAGVELKSADVPPFRVKAHEPMIPRGYFAPDEWKLAINEDMVNNSTLGNDEAADLSNVVLHESRHAEQQFLAARFSAWKNKKNAAGIIAEQGIPDPIARQAVAKKFNAKTDPDLVAQGEKMYDSNVTNAASAQDISDKVKEAIKDLDPVRKAAADALKDLEASVTATTVADGRKKCDALKAQITVVEQKYSMYRSIPHEADAHEVGDAEELAFKGWPP